MSVIIIFNYRTFTLNALRGESPKDYYPKDYSPNNDSLKDAFKHRVKHIHIYVCVTELHLNFGRLKDKLNS